jgi:hypothetical protein
MLGIDRFAGVFFMVEGVVILAYLRPRWLSGNAALFFLFFVPGVALIFRGLLLAFEFDQLGNADYYASILFLPLWIFVAFWQMITENMMPIFLLIALLDVSFVLQQTHSRRNKRQPVWVRKYEPTGERIEKMRYPIVGRPFWAFALSFVAGILILFLGLSFSAWLYPLMAKDLPPSASEFAPLIFFDAPICGIVVLAVGILLYALPKYHVIWGILGVIFSLISVFSLGGFFVGMIFGIVGGSIGVSWKSSPRIEFAPWRTNTRNNKN